MAKTHNTIPPHSLQRPGLFWRKVHQQRPNECWNWTGTISPYGYGVVIRQIHKQRIKLQAHRLAYFLHHKVDPRDLCVCHNCDNTRCCNPAHLFLGTIQDNNLDMKLKGRRRNVPPPLKQGEAHGCAKLSDEQVREIRDKYVPFVYTYNMLAREYKVSRNLINKILNRHLWKHVK